MNLPPRFDALVRKARVARLATVDEQARPHVVPVCFVLRGDVAYILLDAKPKRVPVRSLRRVRNVFSNPEVQLLVDRYAEDWQQLAYVQLRGRASLLESGPEHLEALVLLREKYPQYQEMALEDAPMIRIQVVSHVAWEAGAP